MSFVNHRKRKNDEDKIRDALIDERAPLDPINRDSRPLFRRSQWMGSILSRVPNNAKSFSIPTDYKDLGSQDGSSSLVISLDGDKNFIRKITLANSTPLVFSITSTNFPENTAVELILEFVQDSTGGRNISTNLSASLFPDGERFNSLLDKTASETTRFRLTTYDQGTRWDIEHLAERPTNKLTDLGNIGSTLEIDLNTYSTGTLEGRVSEDTTITFANAPTIFSIIFELTITSTDVPTVTFVDTDVDVSELELEQGDLLEIVVKSTDGGTNVTLGTAKKKADEEGGDVAPSAPTGFSFVGQDTDVIRATWGNPTEGTLPITFDMAYSTSSSEDDDGAPNGDDVVTLTDVESVYDVSSLSAATTYYGWIRAKNDIGNSVWVGPVQTNTDGTVNTGDVSFSLSVQSFSRIRATWTQPTGKGLRFTLKRDLGNDVSKLLADNDSPASGVTNTVDDEDLEPSTAYSYTFEVRNEFGNLLSTLTASASTSVVTVPSFTLSVSGTTITAAVTIPADVESVQLNRGFASNTKGSDGLYSDSGHTSFTVYRLASDGNSAVTKNVVMANLNTNTIFYFQARSQYGVSFSAFSAESNVTTGSYLAPGGIGSLNVTNVSDGVRIRFRFQNDYRGETAVIERRASNSVGEYTPVTSVSRFFDSRDEDDREDRVDITVDNIPNGTWSIHVYAVNETGIGSSDDSDTVIVS